MMMVVIMIVVIVVMMIDDDMLKFVVEPNFDECATKFCVML